MLPATALDTTRRATLLFAAESHRVLGLLAAAVRDGSLALPDESMAQLEPMERGWLGHDLRLERMLLRARRRFARAASRVGCSRVSPWRTRCTASRRCACSATSTSSCRAGTCSTPSRVLEDEFATTRVQPELRPGFDERFGKEVMLRADGLELDLHRIFVEGALGLSIDTDDLFAPPYRFALGGEELEALPMPQRLLHACYAAALGDWPPRLMSLRDVAQLVLYERPNLADVLLMARHVAVRSRRRAGGGDRVGAARARRSPADRRVGRPLRAVRDATGCCSAAHEGPARAFTRHLAALVRAARHARSPRVRDGDRAAAAGVPPGAGHDGGLARRTGVAPLRS